MNSDIRPYKRIERRLSGGLALKTSKRSSDRMGRVRQRATAPELELKRIALGAGLRFTTRNGDLPGSPDLANRKRRVAVFVHGCFWHAHQNCERATIPKTNREFWINKFTRNRERDDEVANALRTMGFRVVVVWECEVTNRTLVANRLHDGTVLSR